MSTTDVEKKSEITSIGKRGELMNFDDFDNFFDAFLNRRWPRFFEQNLSLMSGLERNMPKVDILDHEDELEVQAALPGVNKEDLDISISNQSITIRATTRKEAQEEGKYFRREISRGEYQRTLSLPDYVVPDKAKATFKDGILSVTLPKTEKTKITKVEIQ